MTSLLNFLKQSYKLLSSMKCALFFLMLFMLGMMAGTFVESIYGTTFALRAVYYSWWFFFIEAVLLLSLIFSAINRLPYKQRLLGFYIVHTSLVALIISSGITYYFGTDGSMVLAPGVKNSLVELSSDILRITSGKENYDYKIPFSTSANKLDWELDLPNKVKIRVLNYIPFAKEALRWQRRDGFWLTTWKIRKGQREGSIRLANYFDGRFKNYFLLDGVELFIVPYEFYRTMKTLLPKKAIDKVTLFITKDENDFIRLAYGSGKKWTFEKYTMGELQLPGTDFSLALLEEFSNVVIKENYIPEKPTKDSNKNLQAMQVAYRDLQGMEQKQWITNAQEKQLRIGESVYFLQIKSEELKIPVVLALDHFKIELVPGTMQAASYESFITVSDQQQLSHISMNHPLKVDGYTFYQSSYFQDDHGNYHSVLSVNKDPGRALKYLGAFLLMIGVLVHYLIVYREPKGGEMR
ncbi:MAG: cytochrome c biogenesis protein ResB [Oligoflexia bacterium]|nr:cytochrome c biogenesis protein ResB [Oligoflexia bacterium]